MPSHERIANQHLVEEVSEQERAGKQTSQQQDDDLQGLEDGNGNVHVRRDTQGKHTDNAKHRDYDFCDPRH
jgi:hypothetical protein